MVDVSRVTIPLVAVGKSGIAVGLHGVTPRMSVLRKAQILAAITLLTYVLVGYFLYDWWLG